MMMIETRLAGLVGMIYSTAVAAATWKSPLELVGLPAPVVCMAFAGVAFGLVIQPPKATRLTMFALTVAYTFISAVIAMLVGAIPHMEWTRDAAPLIAGLLGFFAQVAVPAMRGRVQREIRGNDTSGGETP